MSENGEVIPKTEENKDIVVDGVGRQLMNRKANKQNKYKSSSKSKSPPKRSEEVNISADARHENLQVQINNYNFNASKKALID